MILLCEKNLRNMTCARLPVLQTECICYVYLVMLINLNMI